MDHPIFDIIRIANIVLSFMCGGMLLRNWIKYEHWYSSKMRIYVLVLSIWTLLAAAGSLENLLQNNTGGIRVPMTFLALSFELWGLTRPHTTKTLMGG